MDVRADPIFEGVPDDVVAAILAMPEGLRERPPCIGPGPFVRGNAELDAEGRPISLSDVDLVRCNAAALVEAANWLDEATFERMYMLVVGASEPRYFRTVTVPHGGRLPTDRWRGYGWREPPSPVPADVEPAIARAAGLLGDEAPPDLEPAEGRQL